MPETAAEIATRLEAFIAPGYREHLLARGLARGLIWREGQLPVDAPKFSPDLTTDLLDHGFLILALALRLRDHQGDESVIRRSLQVAAEAIESAARNDAVADSERGFHLVMAAAAFHIGGFAARAFSLFEGVLSNFNLATYENALVRLMRRDLVGLRAVSGAWLTNEINSDDGVVKRLAEDDAFDANDALAVALTRLFLLAIASFEMGLVTGRSQYFRAAINRLRRGGKLAGRANHVPLWWSFTVARHLLEDLWGKTMRVMLPDSGGPALWPILRERFIQLVAARSISEIDLWPSQLEAARRVVDASDDLVVALPTSAGKTRIAELCIVRALADEKRVIYVTPLRALSAQIEQSLARTFRPLGYRVTSVYGASGVEDSDLETLKSAQIVVATPEKLDFAIRQEPSVIDDVGLVVLDEGHMIGLGEREIRYEMLVQRLLRRKDASSRRLVCLSAVFADDDTFDDFTAWLRSDAEGDAIRSSWRPTRQRPGRLTWTGTAGRLEFDVEAEKPFVPRFVESQLPTKPRRKSFPSSDQEFVVAATSSFLRRGQSVLVYCPQRRSVEPTAEAFLTAHKQGFFDVVTPDAQGQQAVVDAVRIGTEWLGASHPAVECLTLGVAVHHGSLPRQFLNEIENLLRRRILPVCVCSPTLAQGLDLSFGVLLFRSLFRIKDQTISAKEFANVVGRVGRAFVDLDGLYVLPVFDTNAGKVRFKLQAFNRLIREAKQRKLESGVRLLIGGILTVLKARLNLKDDKLKEYVLNATSSWTVSPAAEDKMHEWLNRALNELDTAILGIVDALDLPVDDLAAYLDECLQSSYWQRRIAREPPELRELQEHVIRGRAKWLWSRTKPQERRAFFAAGIGYKAGSAIGEELDAIEEHLKGAEDAITGSDLDSAVSHAVSFASIMFGIEPFVPEESVDDWQTLLGQWLRGTALGSCADDAGVAFIQQDVVYRLVWAVEAARLQIKHTREADEDPPGSSLALCLMYGVPNLTSAVFMQAGLRSRTLAVSVAATVGATISTAKELRTWIRAMKAGEVPDVTWSTEDERAEWAHFLSGFDYQYITRWRDIDVTLAVDWAEQPPPHTRVRITRTKEGSSTAEVRRVSFALCGKTNLPTNIRCDELTGRVTKDGDTIRVRCFGY